MNEIIAHQFYDDIRMILETSRKKVTKSINSEMLEAYWNIGKRIIDEQDGNENSEYGQKENNTEVEIISYKEIASDVLSEAKK